MPNAEQTGRACTVRTMPSESGPSAPGTTAALSSYGALGTDRYPPFSLGEEPGYPARLDILHPEHLSRGLVLVKWWLLAIPHYIVVGFFLGGRHLGWWDGGLVAVLAVIAAVTLAFTEEHPKSLFDLVLGLNRWALRVAAYAALMTDTCPPFRLDTGGTEPSDAGDPS